MQIVCPNCATSYRVDASSVGPAGRSVRCTRCRTVWFAANTEALAEIAQAHRAEMSEFIAASSVPEAAGEAQEGGSALPDVSIQAEGEGTGDDDWSTTDTIADRAGALAAAGGSAAPDGSMAIVDSPALAPFEQGSGAPEPEDIETVAARHALAHSTGRGIRLPVPGLNSLIAALLAVNVGLVGWRNDVVQFVPQTASLYAALGLAVNLRGLVFVDVKTETQTHDGVHVLLVRGTIVSTAERTVEVPRLRFAIRNQAGNEVYTWTVLPARSMLNPGETLAFQSRLASPPPDTKDVLVRFFSRRDRAAGAE